MARYGHPKIEILDDFYKCTLAYYTLFQAYIIKCPYNLFHRKIFTCGLQM
jgi:hypothetical protein